jgi:hypothetical protein
MKRLLFAILLLPGWAAAQQPFAYSITGQLGPLPPAATVYLRQNRQLLDSTRVRNGHFALRGTSQYPKQVQLLLAPTGVLAASFRARTQYAGDSKELYLEPTPIELTSRTGLRQAKLTAGPINKDYLLFTAQWQALVDQLYERSHPSDGVRLETLESYQREQPFYQRLLTTFIQEHPASWVSLDLLVKQRLGPAQYTQVAPLYAGLSPTLRASPPGRTYGQFLDSLRTVAVGALAPDLTLTTSTGKRVSVRDYRGQYVLPTARGRYSACRSMMRPIASNGCAP